MVRINDVLVIPGEEIAFAVSRSGGPGGQHVNKASTRVTLRFDLEGSPSLSDAQKARIRARLATRVSRAGILQVSCQSSRSQAANREEALERFAALLRGALKRRRPRRPTAVPEKERRRRIETKRRRSEVKRGRAAPGGADE